MTKGIFAVLVQFFGSIVVLLTLVLSTSSAQACPRGQHQSAGHCCASGAEWVPGRTLCVCFLPEGCGDASLVVTPSETLTQRIQQAVQGQTVSLASNAQENAHALTARAENITSQLTSVRSQVEQMVAQQNASSANVTSELARLNSRIDALAHQVEQLVTQQNAISASATNERTRLSSRIDVLVQSISTLSGQVTGLAQAGRNPQINPTPSRRSDCMCQFLCPSNGRIFVAQEGGSNEVAARAATLIQAGSNCGNRNEAIALCDASVSCSTDGVPGLQTPRRQEPIRP